MTDHGLRAGLDAPARAFTKADIDRLVDGMPRGTNPTLSGWIPLREPNRSIWDGEVKQLLYLAAGLTADGEPKPERHRVLWYMHGDGSPFTIEGLHLPYKVKTTTVIVSGHVPITGAGGIFTFVPDEAAP